ncbi:thiosulfate ABC transporter substrate-binding protein CysP [Pseudochelatococcus contaminans]|uniref:Sulfate transport system substrate-binding protein n=1 Tax=Pseudochelatococcus contaminans TaxID=1538103 RepID=A0A7W6EHU6_9HYPH|nr:thiosulfate ABC transporter substrate-binding protein CysP [Pseudochelatococcus contaminans]MBB3810052.1 sulfate transport system substrate-binding protein [Pseudochelatococcus contaminans]
MKWFGGLAIAALVALSGPAAAQQAPAGDKPPVELLNASYDIARELFAAINPVFIEEWKAKTGQDVSIKQSHAGSSAQARAILEGLQADVVTFNQATDIQILHDRGDLVAADWQERLPNNASPFYSFPAFLVREGNPKGIKDWSDLAREGVQPIFPNPKTSGNARYTYLAAYAALLEHHKGDVDKVHEDIKRIFANVPVFDTGGRGATTSFVERGLGDVLITFESEVNGVRREYGDKGYEVVVPPVSILAEFPVSVVDKVAATKGTTETANGYLEFLYSEKGQEILSDFFYRVHDPEVIARHKDRFPEIRLLKVEDVFGGWKNVTDEHFAAGKTLDTLFARK